MSDIDLRDLDWRVRQAPGDLVAIERMIAELMRAGWSWFRIIDQLKRCGVALSDISRVVGRLLRGRRVDPATIRRLIDAIWTREIGGTGPARARKIADAVNTLKELERLLPLLEAGGVALGEALLFFGAGLLLPASRMGEIGIRDPSAELSGEVPDRIFEGFVHHLKLRDDYRKTPSPRALRDLAYDASNLLELIDWYLRSYPDDSRRDDIEKQIRPRIEGFVRLYVWQEGPGEDAPPEPEPNPPTPTGTPAPNLPTPTGTPAPNPPTLSRPPTLEWLEGEGIRRAVVESRARLRKLKRQLAEAEAWQIEYKAALAKAIAGLEGDLARQRARAEEIRQSTAEEWDEPVDPPGEAPPPGWPLGHDWSGRSRRQLYVNRQTGKQEFLTEPVSSDEWKPAVDSEGRPRFRWGWVLRLDPDTNAPSWVPGWVPIDE